MKKSMETLLFLLWAMALIATVGSLFFSEVLGYEPCELCWYQRILMYPLVLIYGTALWKKKWDVAFPGIILSGMGLVVSSYHYALQKIPALSAGDTCGLVPCNGQYINVFGFVTIPFLAGMAFIIIFVVHLLSIVKRRSEDV
ncbi:disulfide bond formation protein DsbB [Halobacillus karajensis]|uniref:Probable disulfide formation protein n=1 Tax=Halobacillus karajensis TaxID=195088 RepID=A0A024P8V0_9BACI|nr:disulfide oxidoreductase [Halobacillus karajensis]CDQ21099.1 Thiol-disulfide oxidoreductase C [Halobacillus karajensis]CDQ24837.1 Thiol-disulfide oxidoreductase C [Halobacillus karajensis]CDQ28803.1 Thiol-disulfide oxidoreductase C [Halobacillus karajensis]SEH96209.1 disulfide bond formation protein DsbB [Halobacillus karajensis]